MKMSKHIGEDTAHQRANETIGYIVVEAAHTNLAGVEFEAASGLDTVSGIHNGPPFPYTFNNPFGTAQVHRHKAQLTDQPNESPSAPWGNELVGFFDDDLLHGKIRR